jgi:hypothetical protein
MELFFLSLIAGLAIRHENTTHAADWQCKTVWKLPWRGIAKTNRVALSGRRGSKAWLMITSIYTGNTLLYIQYPS